MSISNTDIAKQLESLSDNDKVELQRFLEGETQKASIQDSIHQMAQMCFKKCVTSSIRDAKLDSNESACMQNCVDRFMDTNFSILKHLEKMRTG